MWTNSNNPIQHKQPPSLYQRYEAEQRHHRRTFTVPPQIAPVFGVPGSELDDHSPLNVANNWAAPYRSPYTSPWSNRHTGVPSNWYLPVAPPPEYTQFIVRPHQPQWMRQVVNSPLWVSTYPFSVSSSTTPSSSPLASSTLWPSIWTAFMCVWQSFVFFSSQFLSFVVCVLVPILVPSYKYFLFLVRVSLS